MRRRRGGLTEYVGVFPGASGDYASTPDSAAASITGDIDIRVKGALDDWTPGTFEVLASKYTTAGNQRSWYLEVSATGVLALTSSPDGTAVVAGVSTVATGISDGSLKWVRVTVDVDDGAGNRVYKFYTSDDNITWTQLGTTVTTAGTTSFFDSTTPVEVGARVGGLSGNVSGSIYQAQIYNGIDGTLAVDFDPAPYTGGSTFNTIMSDELITNGDFDTDSDWTKGTGWTIGSGVATKTSGDVGTLTQANVAVVGRFYVITYTLSNYSGSGTFRARLGSGSVGQSVSANGTYTDVIIAADEDFGIQAVNSTCGGNFDNVTVKQVTPWTLNGNTSLENRRV